MNRNSEDGVFDSPVDGVALEGELETVAELGAEWFETHH